MLFVGNKVDLREADEAEKYIQKETVTFFLDFLILIRLRRLLKCWERVINIWNVAH